ncbi:hypothetical protein [Gluconacetobacter diazotrophicus]|uniref:hypothetical protein n=1 Tax=Gluconacetobacter diazotrophicus TaxID=33996 RepID=UPI00218020BE|nr:hypothetical protein [Gluconacetobacter diazotrophicus]
MLLAACGGAPTPEPVLLGQFNQNTDRFGVISTVGKAEGTIQKDGRTCDIYKIYTTGLTAGGRAAVKAAEVLSSVATLGVAQIGWAIGKAGTRPQLHTVLFCFGPNDKLVDIFDKDPTDSTGPDHLIVNRAAYASSLAARVIAPARAVPEVAAAPAAAAPVAVESAPQTAPAVVPVVGATPAQAAVSGTGEAPIIYEKPVAPKASAAAGAISLDNVSQEATTGRAQVSTGSATITAGASADDLNAISARKSEAANKPALGAAPVPAP